MDSADLKVFEAVARLGGMNRAAAELNTVQSNVTARIRRLEEGLGTRLFERHSRGVALTPGGRRLLPYASQVAQLLDDAHRAVQDDGAPQGALLIGSLETTAAVRLSPVIAAFAAAYPAGDLVLRTGTTSELIERVLDRELEGAFVCGPVRHPALDEATLFHEELVLLSGRAVTSLDDLAQQEDLKIVVLRAGCSYRLKLEALLAERGVVGFRLLEFGTLEAIVACVGAGLGVTLLPRSLLGPVLREREIRVHALPAEEGRVETSFIRRRDGFVSSALEAFLDSARATLPAAAE